MAPPSSNDFFVGACKQWRNVSDWSIVVTVLGIQSIHSIFGFLDTAIFLLLGQEIESVEDNEYGPEKESKKCSPKFKADPKAD